MQPARGSETGRRCVRSSRCHLPLCCNQHVVTGTSRTAPHHAASGLTAARLHVHEPGMDNHNPYLESLSIDRGSDDDGSPRSVSSDDSMDER